eukprot:3935785-Rhodomonas_salina.1
MMFLGLVGTTLGCLSPDVILMRFGLAHRTAEAYFVAHGLDAVSPTSGKYTLAFLQRRSSYEHRFTSCLSLALCRAAGSRGVLASAQHYRADTELAAVLAGASRRRRKGVVTRRVAVATVVTHRRSFESSLVLCPAAMHISKSGRQHSRATISLFLIS